MSKNQIITEVNDIGSASKTVSKFLNILIGLIAITATACAMGPEGIMGTAFVVIVIGLPLYYIRKANKKPYVRKYTDEELAAFAANIDITYVDGSPMKHDFLMCGFDINSGSLGNEIYDSSMTHNFDMYGRANLNSGSFSNEIYE